MRSMRQRKREAAEFLDKRGRRIEIIFFGLLLVFVTFTPIYFYYCFDELFQILTKFICRTNNFSEQIGKIIEIGLNCVSICLIAIFVLLVTLPVYSSFFTHSYKIYRNSIAGQPKYFSFRPKDYFSSILSGFFIALTLAICLAPVMTIFNVALYFTGFTEGVMGVVGQIIKYSFPIFIVIGLVIGFIIFLLFYPFFLFPYFVAKGRNAFYAIGMSVRYMLTKRGVRLYLSYIVSFLPSLLLSLITILVLFLIDTLPKMSIVYFDVAEDIVYGNEFANKK